MDFVFRTKTLCIRQTSIAILFTLFARTDRSFFSSVWLQSRAIRYEETVKYYSDHKINGRFLSVAFGVCCCVCVYVHFTTQMSLASCYLSDIFNTVPNDRIEFVRMKSIFNLCQRLRQFKSCERSALSRSLAGSLSFSFFLFLSRVFVSTKFVFVSKWLTKEKKNKLIADDIFEETKEIQLYSFNRLVSMHTKNNRFKNECSMVQNLPQTSSQPSTRLGYFISQTRFTRRPIIDENLCEILCTDYD